MVSPTEDDKIIHLSDHYHTYSSILLTEYLNPSSAWSPAPGVEPLADNLLMNGRNIYNCSVPSTTYPPNTNASACTNGKLYKTSVSSGSKIRFHLKSHAAYFSYYVAFDNHMIEIVELDGVEIISISASGVFLNTGQRVSVTLHASQTPKYVGIHVFIPFFSD